MILYLVGLGLLFLTHRGLKFQSYDLKDVVKNILDTEFAQNIPPFIGIFLFFIIPLIFPILGRLLFQHLLLPYKPSKVIETLYDRCWEVIRVGSGWIESRLDKILADVDGFRVGLQVTPAETAEICNGLYHSTHTKNVVATCLQTISDLYSNTEKKMYLSTTMRTIAHLKRERKFSFARYLIGSEDFNNLFNGSPTADVKWFVQIHQQADAKLFYADLDMFKGLSTQNGISEEQFDVLFFDCSAVFFLQTAAVGTRNSVVELPNGKNILFVMDEKQKLLAYGKVFGTLKSQLSSYKDVIKIIKDNNWNSLYGIRENQDKL